jgi:hypothetical protein
MGHAEAVQFLRQQFDLRGLSRPFWTFQRDKRARVVSLVPVLVAIWLLYSCFYVLNIVA